MNNPDTKYASFPGKTFLIGEYAVLEGAPGILINTHPRFLFAITKRRGNAPLDALFSSQFDLENKERNFQKIKPKPKPKPNTTASFHPGSPAGQWLKLHPQIEQSYDIKFYDPYFGKGGFGFSSAQFNLVYLLHKLLTFFYREDQKKKRENSHFSLHTSFSPGSKKEEEKILFPQIEVDLLQMWKSYRNLSFTGQTPSGADVISQWVGNICLFESHSFKVRSVRWPFTDLDFFLIRTGIRLDTWEHLNIISGKKNYNFFDLTKQAIVCMDKKDKKGFVSIVNDYAVCLEKQGLVHEKTLMLLSRIKKIKSIIAAKGCGAMGAEVVVVFFDSKNKKTLKSRLSKENIVAHSDDLTGGISFF